jgi:hypothetical protein
MGFYVLSARGMVSSVSYDPLFELEDIWAESLSATILAPQPRALSRWALQTFPTALNDLAQRWVRRTVGLYQPLDRLAPTPATGEPHTLIIIALYGAELGILDSIPQWRQRFDRVVAYVFDAWNPEQYPSLARSLDHLFVPMPEIIGELQHHLGIPVSLLPFGTDALVHGAADRHRPIDLLSYGRIPTAHHQALMQRFNCPGSPYLYYRSTPRPKQDLPTRPYADRRDREDTAYLYHMLRKSKLVLAYDTLYPGMREFPHSFLTLRWFQGGATGCTIVGKRPTTPLASELLDWPDATIELPDDPQDCANAVVALLQDGDRLQRIAQRNYLENLQRHDWRLRLHDLLAHLDMPITPMLQRQLLVLKARGRQVAQEMRLMELAVR